MERECGTVNERENGEGVVREMRRHKKRTGGVGGAEGS